MRAVRRVVVAGAMAVATSGAQEAPVACLRVGFGTWTPPLAWSAAGHGDSAARVGARDRALRDSVYDGAATATGREEMKWMEGGRQLILYPPWWPVGVVIAFERSALTLARGDTIVGAATALVADAGRPPPRATARVVRAGC